MPTAGKVGETFGISGCRAFQPVKPKSWDNLTTKAFGGYGFGYGYMDASSSNKNPTHSSSSCNTSSNTMPAKIKSHSKTNATINLNQINFKSKSGGRIHSIQICHGSHRNCNLPVKSTESLLLLKNQSEIFSNSSLSCECLEIGSPSSETAAAKRYFPVFRTGESDEFCCHHRDKASQTEVKHRRAVEKQTGNVSRL